MGTYKKNTTLIHFRASISGRETGFVVPKAKSYKIKYGSKFLFLMRVIKTIKKY